VTNANKALTEPIVCTVHLVTLHPLFGIAFLQIFYCATQDSVLKKRLKMFLFNIARMTAVQHLCSSTKFD